MKFDGFLKVYFESTDDEQTAPDDMNTLPVMEKGTELDMLEMVATQRFTQQPLRYTEASLVRKLEELGIGRPSTYAPTISTIQQREYVVKGENKGEKRDFEVITLKDERITSKTKSELVGSEKGKLLPTDTGMIVNDFLIRYFPAILDYHFTAQVEEKFDDIAEGKERWNDDIEQFYADFHPNIEKVSSLRLEHKVGERMLGKDPKTGKPVSVKIGRYGPVVQLGSSEDKEKPRFASLLKDQSMATITLEQALKMFELPRTLGTFEDEVVTVAVGKFGPYVKHGKEYASIPKDLSPQEVSLQQAVQLIMNKREAEVQKIIKTFEEEPELQVLNGRFGPYICYQKQNYKIPRKLDAAALTLDECRAIIADEANASKPKRRTATRRTKK